MYYRQLGMSLLGMPLQRISLTLSWNTIVVSSPGMTSSRRRQDSECSSTWLRSPDRYSFTSCHGNM